METLRTAEKTPIERFDHLWEALKPVTAGGHIATGPDGEVISVGVKAHVGGTPHPTRRQIDCFTQEGRFSLTDKGILFAGNTPDVLHNLVSLETIVGVHQEVVQPPAEQ